MIDYNRIAEMAEHRRAQVRQEAEAAQLLRASRPAAPSSRFAFFVRASARLRSAWVPGFSRWHGSSAGRPTRRTPAWPLHAE